MLKMEQMGGVVEPGVRFFPFFIFKQIILTFIAPYFER